MKSFLALILSALGASAAALYPINVGTTANDGTGDNLRAAFTKLNSNSVSTARELDGSASLNMHRAVNFNRAQATNGQLAIGALGDSMGVAKFTPLVRTLWAAYGTNGGAMFGGTDNSFYYGVSGATNMLPLSDARATNWFVNYFDLGVADSQTWNGYVGGSVYADRLQIAFITGLGGSWKLQTSILGGAFADYGAAVSGGSYGAVFTNITVPLGYYRFRVVGVTGRTVVVGGGYQNSTGTGLYAAAMAEGGIDWSHVARVSTNVLTPVLSGLGLHALLVEEKSGSTNVNDFAFGVFDKIRSQSLTNGDLILLGSTPINSLTLDPLFTVPQNAALRAYALTNGVAYFDGYSPFTTNQITLRDPTWDGTHPPAEVQSSLANLLAYQLGIPANAGYLRDLRGVRTVTPADVSNVARTNVPTVFASTLHAVGNLSAANHVVTDGAAFSFWWRSGGVLYLNDNSIGTQFKLAPGSGLGAVVSGNAGPIVFGASATEFVRFGSVVDVQNNSVTNVSTLRINSELIVGPTNSGLGAVFTNAVHTFTNLAFTLTTFSQSSWRIPVPGLTASHHVNVTPTTNLNTGMIFQALASNESAYVVAQNLNSVSLSYTGRVNVSIFKTP